jgi:hypothetical protein
MFVRTYVCMHALTREYAQHASVNVNEGDELEYKYCIVGSDGGIARWENKGSGDLYVHSYIHTY